MGYMPPLENTQAVKPIPGSQEKWDVGVYNGNLDGIEAAVAEDRGRLDELEAVASAQFMFLATSDSYMFETNRTRLVGSIGEPEADRNLPYVEISDLGDWHSASVTTERITPKVRGFYSVTVDCGWGGNGTGSRVLELRKNTSALRQAIEAAPPANARASTAIALQLVELNGTTDYLAVQLSVPNMAGIVDYHLTIRVRLERRT
jgi:hypothetical protein